MELKKRVVTLTSALVVGLAVLGSIPATSAMAQVEVLDEQQLLGNLSQKLGGEKKLGQTFTRDVPGQVTTVQLKIRRNIAAAAPLTLHVLRSDFTVLDSVTIPAAAMPVGVVVWQTFDFNGDGDALVGAPFYGLLLESPASPEGAYSWYGSGANPYPGPDPTRQGFYHDGPGWMPMTPIVINGGENWDYTFRITIAQ